MTRAILRTILLASFVFAFAPRAVARRPYDRADGSFERKDGKTVFVFKHYVDGIVVADPVSVQFRLADGTEIASTSYTGDGIIFPASTGRRVYQYASSWFPVADRVEDFDGFSLTNVTSLPLELASPIIHLAWYWQAYSISLAISLALFASWKGLEAMPRRSSFKVARVIGYCVVAPVGGLYFLILLYGPISAPLVLLTGFLLAKLGRSFALKWARRASLMLRYG
jgi:hypothetical protein